MSANADRLADAIVGIYQRLAALEAIADNAGLVLPAAWDEGASAAAEAIWEHEKLPPNPYRNDA